MSQEPSTEVRRITDALRFARQAYENGADNQEEVRHWEAALKYQKKVEGNG